MWRFLDQMAPTQATLDERAAAAAAAATTLAAAPAPASTAAAASTSAMASVSTDGDNAAITDALDELRTVQVDLDGDGEQQPKPKRPKNVTTSNRALIVMYMDLFSDILL